MDCNGFKNWLASRDAWDENTSRQARTHRENCPACERLYVFDQGMEQAIFSGVRRARGPSGLARRARNLAEAESRSSAPVRPVWLWRGLAPALALGLLLLVWHPWANPLNSLEVIAHFALANHTRADMRMAFTADDTPDPQGWFLQRLNYRVPIPSLAPRGFTFLGGRECTIGPKKAAYLFYDDNGRHVSVFVIPERQLEVALQTEHRYRIDTRQHSLELWKMDTMVCILVQDRNPAAPSTT